MIPSVYRKTMTVRNGVGMAVGAISPVLEPYRFYLDVLRAVWVGIGVRVRVKRAGSMPGAPCQLLPNNGYSIDNIIL